MMIWFRQYIPVMFGATHSGQLVVRKCPCHNAEIQRHTI